MNDDTVPMNATAEQAGQIVKAALAWRWMLDDDDRMTREQWQLVIACEAYGDTYKGLVSK